VREGGWEELKRRNEGSKGGREEGREGGREEKREEKRQGGREEQVTPLPGLRVGLHSVHPRFPSDPLRPSLS
jgi:hypothetical protein